MSKILYISDLDGTLLRSDETTSGYTNDTLNQLTQEGLLFSYATARSFHTAKKATKGLQAKIPLIVYNGAFIVDNVTGEVLAENFFDNMVYDLLKDLFKADIYPIIYAMINGAEKFSYIECMSSKGLRDFAATRTDSRKNPVDTVDELISGDIFYITCIDDAKKLYPLYMKYKNIYRCIYHVDIYSQEQWLEIMPVTSTKANAIGKLKKILGCDRVIAFGDAINDIDMFKMADECYAVQNAAPELKAIATGIISSNDEDAVVKWLEQNGVGEE